MSDWRRPGWTEGSEHSRIWVPTWRFWLICILICGILAAAFLILLVTQLDRDATTTSTPRPAGTPPVTGGTPPPSSISQEQLQINLSSARNYLVPGRVRVPTSVTVEAGQDLHLSVTVCGDEADVPQCVDDPILGPTGKVAEGSVQPGKSTPFMIGALIAAWATGPSTLTVDPSDKVTQSVIEETDHATWDWWLRSTDIGNSVLVIHLQQEYEDSGMPLQPDTELDVAVAVQPAPAARRSSATNQHHRSGRSQLLQVSKAIATWPVAGTAPAVVVAAAVAVWRTWLKRRRKSKYPNRKIRLVGRKRHRLMSRPQAARKNRPAGMRGSP